MDVDQAIDISEAARTTVLELLGRHLPRTKAWVYGSRVMWTSTPQSDLDLVVCSSPEQRRQVADLREAFEESNLPFRVDLFVWDEVSDSFRSRIESERVTLVEAIDERSPLGRLPSGWECSTLGEVCERGGGSVQTGPFGSQLHASDYRPAGIPSIMPQNLGDNRVIVDGIARIGERDANRLRRYLVREGDIVYSRRGDVERRALIGTREDGWLCGTGCLRVRLGENGVDPRYASYYLGHPAVREWIVRHAHGATMPNLNTAILSACPFVVPPRSEQRAIAHILGTLDDRIELNRQMNDTLEAMARALFKSWFVDFDHIRAKMEGRDTGLRRHVADLFPCRFVESEIGEVPMGWDVVPLSHVIDVNPTRPLRKGEIAPYLDMANMPTKGHTPQAVIDRPYGSGMRFTNGDTLVARITPCLENGKTAYVDFLQSGTTGWGSTEYIVMRPRPPLPSEFAYCLARSSQFRAFLIRNMSGTSGRQRVPGQAVSQFMCVSPPAAIAREFEKIVQPVMARASVAARESRRLSRLRDTLLPRLVAGELRINRSMEDTD